jgi:hypothetical protein
MASHVLNLHKMKVEGSKLGRPVVSKITTKSFGKVSCVRYFVKNKYGKFMVQATSKDDSFKKILTIDVSNRKFQMSKGITCKSMPDKIAAILLLWLATDAKPGSEKVKTQGSPIITISILDVDNKVSITSGLSEQIVNKIEELSGKKITSFQKFMAKLPVALTVGFTAVSLVAIIYKYIKFLFRWKSERKSDAREKIADQEIFSSQSEDDPAFIDYSYIKKVINNVITGRIRACTLCGPPGMSKTYMVKRCMYFAGMEPGKDFIVAKGSVITVKDFFVFVYENRDKILVLDDFDSPLTDRDMVNMLKAMMDSYGQRRVFLPKTITDQEQSVSKGQVPIPSSVPTRFDFEGRVILVTNIKKGGVDKAIKSRAIPLEVNFNAKRMLNILQKMMKHMEPKEAPMKMKQEVFNYIMQLYKKKPDIIINFRNYHDAVCLRLGISEGWKECVKEMVEFN